MLKAVFQKAEKHVLKAEKTPSEIVITAVPVKTNSANGLKNVILFCRSNV